MIALIEKEYIMLRNFLIGVLTLITANVYAIGFNHETVSHIHNCTGQPLIISWEGYNLSFDSEAQPFTLHSGEFSAPEFENMELIKALWAFFNPSPNGSLDGQIRGPNIDESFTIKLNGVLPEGRLVYFANTEGISFAKSHIEFANVNAINTVYIGC